MGCLKQFTWSLQNYHKQFLVAVWLPILLRARHGTGDKAPTWDYCDCRFLSWATWSDCTERCYGRRQRSRQVEHTIKSGCEEFTDCASNDMGWDYQTCNKVCYNGGSYSGWRLVPCHCTPGWHGRCCDSGV